MKKIALSEVKDDLSRYLHAAEIERARNSIKAGKGIKLENA
jgi:hypothetical protein